MKIIVVPSTILIKLASSYLCVDTVTNNNAGSNDFVVARWTTVEPSFVVDLSEDQLYSDPDNNRYPDAIRAWNIFKERNRKVLITSDQYKNLILNGRIESEAVTSEDDIEKGDDNGDE